MTAKAARVITQPHRRMLLIGVVGREGEWGCFHQDKSLLSIFFFNFFFVLQPLIKLPDFETHEIVTVNLERILSSGAGSRGCR